MSHLAVKSLFCERGRPRCYQAPEPGTRHWPLWATRQHSALCNVLLYHTILYSLALYPTVLFFGLVAICYGILDVCWSMVAHLIIFVRDAPGSFFQLLEMSCSRHISYMYRWCLAKYIISITLYIFVCATYVHLSLYQPIIVSYLYNQLSVLQFYIYVRHLVIDNINPSLPTCLSSFLFYQQIIHSTFPRIAEQMREKENE